MDTISQQPEDTEYPNIPGYRMVRELAGGGSANVYLAVQTSFERQVAIKLMTAVASDTPRPDKPASSQHFQREAQIAARLSHPNIITVYDVGEHENHLYIAMEYHQGGDLKQRLQQNMTTKRAMVILRQIASALDYAHSKGYIHRDIKPDNILFSEDDNAILTDFGIAHKALLDDVPLAQANTVTGTPQYMSPEQVRGQPLDARSDLYSLGIVFYEMLMGEPPFDHEDISTIGMMHLNDPVPPLPDKLAPLQPLLDGLLAKDASGRFPSGRELIDRIDQLRMSGALRNQKLGTVRPLRATQADRVSNVAPATKQDNPAPRERKTERKQVRKPAGRIRRHGPAAVVLGITALGAGLFYAQATGQLDHWLDDASQSDNPQVVAFAEWMQQMLQQWETEGFSTSPELTHVAPTAREDRISTMTAERLGTAIGSQLYPGIVGPSALATNAAAALVDIDPGTLSEIDPRAELIDEKLSLAESLEAAGRTVAPEDGNAAAAYREVLALDPANDSAQQGLQRIALGLVDDASRAIDSQSWDEAREALHQAAALSPGLEEITAAEAQLDSAYQAEQARQAQARADAAAAAQARDRRADALLSRFKITGLLKNAEYDIGAGRYTSPTGNNALQKYRDVLRLSPDNPAALRGLQRLEQRVVADLDAAIASGEQDRAKALRQQLMQINPDHPRVGAAP